MKRPFQVTPDEAALPIQESPYVDPDEVARILKRYKERARREGLDFIVGLLEAKKETSNER